MPEDLLADPKTNWFTKTSLGQSGDALAEQRREPRYFGNDMPVGVTPLLGGPQAEVTATLRDISVSGVGVDSPTAMTIGSKIVLRLKTANTCKMVLCQVMHSTPQENGLYRVGAKLKDIRTEIAPETPIPEAWLG